MNVKYTKEDLKKSMLNGIEKYHNENTHYRICCHEGINDSYPEYQYDFIEFEEIYNEILKEHYYDVWLEEAKRVWKMLEIEHSAKYLKD